MNDARSTSSLSYPIQPTLICFSHLRWDFVWQRPQHLMGHFAGQYRVFFWEEMIATDHHLPYLEFHAFDGTTVQSIRPRVPAAWSAERQAQALSVLLDQMLLLTGTHNPVLWFYTPMMWPIARHVEAAAVVYDCMDELSAFRFAPPGLIRAEDALLNAADLVFTGGVSIWEAKAHRHANIHAFPSSVDTAHFAQARGVGPAQTPADQDNLPRPRLGYYGVIDERLDLDLIAALADARPDWSVVMVGPVAKISPDDLPRRANIHWLGQKSYDELPGYLAGWDVALMPFALNDATRFISPTKTPEYLAGGVQVVSTAVRDVVRHYGDLAAVRIAADTDGFVAACDAAIAQCDKPEDWRPAADAMLSQLSWDRTFDQMAAKVDGAVRSRMTVLTPARIAAPVVLHRGPRHDVTICGAGFAGATLARQFAEMSGRRVLVVDKRSHVGGNAYDEHDAAGILVHRYGPHIFHTNSEDVFNWLGRFTEWRHYEHRVLARVGDMSVPVPINRTTLNMLYGLDLTSDEQAQAYLASKAQPIADIRTSRDVVVSAVGQQLYETFFQGYTRKQWGLDPSQLDKTVTARVPTRTNQDDRYFNDRFQVMPRDGYTRMFERILDHPRIELALGTDFHDLAPDERGAQVVYTGPIDTYFGHRFGPLPYRSLRFRHETLDMPQFQPTGVENFPSEAVAWTRITEYKHLTGQIHPKTSISYEYPMAEGEPYYPIPRPENATLFRKYEALAAQEKGVIFAGRLGSYRYYNMDQVVGQALSIHRRLMQVPDNAKALVPND